MSKDPRKRWMGALATPGKAGPAPGRPKKETPRMAHGLGLTSERSRRSMVQRIERAGVHDARVLSVMGEVPRHLFVDEGLASRAYEDSALPIGHHQTISQPYIVARMTELVCHGARPNRVLEIGTGCGYQAAVLAGVAVEVYSVERIRALHDRARLNLRTLRLANLRLVYGDGLEGLPEVAPFDGMLIAAAAPDLPQSLLNQLSVGGRAVAPLGDREQTLCLIERHSAREFSKTLLEPVRFVPLHPGVR